MLIHIVGTYVCGGGVISQTDGSAVKTKRKSGHRAWVGGGGEGRNVVGVATGGVGVGHKGFKLPDINHALPATSDIPSQSFASERGSD